MAFPFQELRVREVRPYPEGQEGLPYLEEEGGRREEEGAFPFLEGQVGRREGQEVVASLVEEEAHPSEVEADLELQVVVVDLRAERGACLRVVLEAFLGVREEQEARPLMEDLEVVASLVEHPFLVVEEDLRCLEGQGARADLEAQVVVVLRAERGACLRVVLEAFLGVREEQEARPLLEVQEEQEARPLLEVQEERQEQVVLKMEEALEEGEA